MNEKDTIIPVEVYYEWKPRVCNGMGHSAVNYVKPVGRKEWKPKGIVNELKKPPDVSEVPEKQDEFTKVRNPSRRILTILKATNTQNVFDVLNDNTQVVVICDIVCDQSNQGVVRGSPPPSGYK